MTRWQLAVSVLGLGLVAANFFTKGGATIVKASLSGPSGSTVAATGPSSTGSSGTMPGAPPNQVVIQSGPFAGMIGTSV